HMVFKGTTALLPGMFDQIVEGLGGMTNAATSYDYAHFYVTAAADQGKVVFEPLAELILRAAIPDGEFDRERSVVLEEMRQAEDSPDWLGYEALLALVYPEHPYGRPILGTPETLLERSPEEMRRFHRCHYQPENMTVVIAGQVDQATALGWTSELFQGFPIPEASAPEDCVAEVPAIAPSLPEGQRRYLRLPYLEQARLMMGWRAPGWSDAETTDALDVLAVILASGRTSRLVRELREERQWVYDISCECNVQADSTLFVITAWLDWDRLESVEGKIRDHLEKLQDYPVTDEELRRAKRLLINDHQFSCETPSQLASLYGYYNAMGSVTDALTYPDQVQAVTPELLQKVAGRYLMPHRYCSVILEPEF
ncbi:MAG: pitrilysin family protein, partial [Cyanobacteria bacterium P01_H01_bin.130]